MDPAVALSEARRRAGLSQVELARRAGTSQATISAYERGAKQPSVSTLARLLAVTGHRLEAMPAASVVREPSRADLARSGRGLAEVVALAEALPVRHRPSLEYPHLGAAGGRRSRPS